MSRFFDFLDRFKYGIIAAVAAYVALFMYLEMESYTQYFPIQPFHDGSFVEIPEDEVELKSENIQVPSGYQDVKNVARDVNDKRKRSEDNWDRNMSAKDVEQSVKDYEKRLFEESGGEAQRKKYQQEMEQRRLENANKPKKENTTQSNSGGNTAAAGSVAAEWELSGRSPHQNNEWWVRKPNYMCESYGSVLVRIKVNQNGDVIEAKIDPAKSNTSDGCIVKYALEYARKSRFNYSSGAPSLQSGYIMYTFQGQ